MFLYFCTSLSLHLHSLFFESKLPHGHGFILAMTVNAAGYDIRTAEAFADTFVQFDAVVGFKYLRGMHINDSKKALASHVDRHDSIGKGLMGLTTFELIMSDSRFDEIPLILETPDETVWPEEIASLKKMAGEK